MVFTRAADSKFQLAFWCVICLLAGLGCLIAGIVFFAAPGFYDPNEASSETSAYNALVAAWEPTVFGGTPTVPMAQLAAAGSNITLASSYGSVTLMLTAVDYGAPAAPSGSGIAVQRTRLAYVGYGTLLGPAAVSWSGGTFNLPVTATSSATNRVLFTAQVQLAWQSSYPKGKGGCSYGSSSGSTCNVYYTPAPGGVCLAVDASSSSQQWQATGGCAISSSSVQSAALAGTTDQIWQATNAAAYAAGGGSTFIAFPSSTSFPVVVRSARDPWVYAAQATYGQMVWGAHALAYLRLATILTAVGGALLLPFALCFCVIVGLSARDCITHALAGVQFGAVDLAVAVRTRSVAAFDGAAVAAGKAATRTLRTLTGRGWTAAKSDDMGRFAVDAGAQGWAAAGHGGARGRGGPQLAAVAEAGEEEPDAISFEIAGTQPDRAARLGAQRPPLRFDDGAEAEEEEEDGSLSGYHTHSSALAVPSYSPRPQSPQSPRANAAGGGRRVVASLRSASSSAGSAFAAGSAASSASRNPLDSARGGGGGGGGEGEGAARPGRRQSRFSIVLPSRSSRDILAANRAVAARAGGGAGLQVGVALSPSSMRAASAWQRRQESGSPAVPAIAAGIDARGNRRPSSAH